MPSQLVAVIGGAAGLGAAFRSPLLAVAYGLEELGQRSGLPLVLPVLLQKLQVSNRTQAALLWLGLAPDKAD
jgi:H+/Cl- antiporter ClcA